MRRFTVVMVCNSGGTAAHRIKAKDAKAAHDAYADPCVRVVAVVDGWPKVSGVDDKQ